MKSYAIISVFLFLCNFNYGQENKEADTEKQTIEVVLNQWHKAAANADFDKYFGFFTSDAIFIGTDATENWTLPDFKKFAKPYFVKGKAWSFTPLERHIFVKEDVGFAWFDELLETQMGICRGSGVLIKKNKIWNIQHYVLSIAIPNDDVKKVTEMKKNFDNKLMDSLKN